MFNSSLYQLVVLLLTLMIAAQLATQGMLGGSLEILVRMHTGPAATQSQPEAKPVEKSEDMKKGNERNRSYENSKPVTYLWLATG